MPDTIKKYAILHKQICDNFPRCPAMIVCQEKSKQLDREPAIYFHDGKIDINKENCIGCALCLEKCGLFRIVSGLYSELEYQKEFDNDPRNKIDISAERFGCDVIDKSAYLLNDLYEVSEYIFGAKHEKVNIMEFIDESLAMCPFQAIAVNDIRRIFKDLGEYRKFIIPSSDLKTFDEVEKMYKINQFPAILLIYNGEILGDPILTEFRVSQEDQRNQVQFNLESAFSKRMQLFLNKKNK